MLRNKYLVAKIGFDSAANEPIKFVIKLLRRYNKKARFPSYSPVLNEGSPWFQACTIASWPIVVRCYRRYLQRALRAGATPEALVDEAPRFSAHCTTSYADTSTTKS